jgi:ABC-type nitrate/sulfonate/bicarbonate transport system permease component
MRIVRTPRRTVLSAALGVTGVLGFLASWQLAPTVGIVDGRYLPPASDVLARLLDDLGESAFWQALADTMLTWMIGLVMAAVAAIALGTVIGLSRVLRRGTGTTVEFLRPIPSVALIPLAILLFGLQREAALVIVVWAAFWQIFIQVLHGVADIDAVARDTARSFGLGAGARLRFLVLPTMLPYLSTGLRLGGTVALILAITAEMVIGNPGLGRLLQLSRSGGDTAGVYALVVVAGLLGLGINLILRALERRVLAWHHTVRAEVV